MGLTKEDLIPDLVRLGTEKGDCLALGVSLRSIGWVEGGPDTLIDALVSAVGEEGTIFIPAYSMVFPIPLSRRRGYHPQRVRIRPGYDPTQDRRSVDGDVRET
jgi:aminoglycoside N3'-acetyltransferase